MSLHKETRHKLQQALAQYREKHANSVVVLEGGKAECRHDTDHEFCFRQESYFHYLFGVKEPDFYGALELDTGKSFLFIPRLPAAYAVWMGTIHPPEHFVKMYGVDEAYYVDELSAVLQKKGTKSVLVLNGKNTDSGAFHSGASFEGMDKFELDKTTLFPALSECRVTKTEEELKVMRYVIKISSEAHNIVMQNARVGMHEYQLESLFRHYVYEKGGCRHTSYTCICASGPNSATLHYGHAGQPNARKIGEGEMMMFDMGGEYHCYGADISRSFPISGKFTQPQREIYGTVLAAQEAVMKEMKVGVSWPAMHRLADRVICQELLKHGYLKGNVDDMMKHFIGSIFMPHGLGHLLGIDTHDVGGYPVHDSTIVRSTEPGLKSLRIGRVLLENMVLTVEPGVYFITSVLEEAINDPVRGQFLVADKIRAMYGFGGVRIEDNVVVLKDGIENMSRFSPRSIEAIEELMAKGK